MRPSGSEYSVKDGRSGLGPSPDPVGLDSVRISSPAEISG